MTESQKRNRPASFGTDSGTASQVVLLDPGRMRQVGEVDERFQSYNVEMVEVTGGRFWKPYDAVRDLLTGQAAPAGQGSAPAGMNPDLYMYRPPLDLGNRRLRRLAGALGPAYMRVSGTWANTTFFDPEGSADEPPAGYGAVLTREQWLGVLDFSSEVDAPVVTSMPVGAGSRNAAGIWLPDQARGWIEFTLENGGDIAGAEFFNEPNLASMGGAPAGYTAADYARDHQRFEELMREMLPDALILAPGSVGEARTDWAVAAGGYGDLSLIQSEALLEGVSDADVFSYHHYGAVSLRCQEMGFQTSVGQALSDEWLARTGVTLEYYRPLRDRFLPGKPIWNTETAESACGGNPWAKTFLDTFRYVDQLGRLARQGVSVVMHNTLAASDYALLDENTFAPRPSYWAALLWRRLMGTTVLDPGVETGSGLHVYTHGSRNHAGGVAAVLINTDTRQGRAVTLGVPGVRYSLTAAEPEVTQVDLNGRPLVLGLDDELPALDGASQAAGELLLPPLSITFIEFNETRDAGDAAAD